MKLDKKDKDILRILQQNGRMKAKEIAKRINSPITTVVSKIKRMEKNGIIKGYTAIVDNKAVGMPVIAYVLISFNKSSNISQKELAKKLAEFKQVCEVSIIAGEWDILVKVKEENVESIGNFVVEKLRNLEGIEKTLTLIVLHNEKESLEVLIK